MPTEVLLVVLGSALLHAGWNALVRASADKFLASLHVVGGAGVFALLLLPWLPAPHAASWPWALASGLIHVVYFSLVARAYRGAALALAYPLMRGTAPVLTALAAALWLGEWLGAAGWLAVALVCAGVLSLAAASRRLGHGGADAARAALANAAVIALYTLVDGQGVRAAGHALAYTAWVFLITAVLLLAVAWQRRGAAALRPTAAALRTTTVGGAGTLGAYALVLWAMTQAPIALVAALRESAIVMAMLIGWVVLRERPTRAQWLAALLVGCGAALMRLG
ncbi:MAG: EamA family transporter [Hylemonella sp.]